MTRSAAASNSARDTRLRCRAASAAMRAAMGPHVVAVCAMTKLTVS